MFDIDSGVQVGSVKNNHLRHAVPDMSSRQQTKRPTDQKAKRWVEVVPNPLSNIPGYSADFADLNGSDVAVVTSPEGRLSIWKGVGQSFSLVPHAAKP